MNNTMNFSYMTRICHNILKTAQAQGSHTQADKVSFQDTLLEKGMDGVSDVSAIERAYVKNMSMAEYKLYIYDKIGALPVHSSNMADSVSVHITDEGFEAMKNDAEYEKWVLDCLETNFRCPDSWSGVCGGKFTVFYFGATKEESRAESWRLGFRHGNEQKLFDEKSKDSFWERRKKRRQELLAQLEEMEEKKAVAKRMAKSRCYAEMAAQKPENGESIRMANYDMLAMQIFSSFKANILLETFSGKKA